MTLDKSGELRHGWRNLAAATIGLGLGIASYTPVSSLFFTELEREFGWSKVAATGALIALPIAALVLPLAGWLIDRFGVRLVSGASAALAAASYLWLSRMSGAAPEFYAALIALNVLGCATGPVAYTRLVAAQFSVSRGLALAIAQFGIAFIAVLMPQLVGGMIAEYGWRGGYLFFAGATAVGAVGAQALMQPVPRVSAKNDKSGGTSARTALNSAGFWILGFAILLISAAAFGLVAQFQPLLADRGLGARAATILLSLLAVAVMLSRLIVGRLLDLAAPARWAAAVMAIAACGAALLWLGPTGLVVTTLAVALLGFSIGAELDLMSFFCARLFGIRHYAAIYGLLSMFFYAGIAIGGVGYGVSRSLTGSYAGGLFSSTLALVAAAILFLFLGRQPMDMSGTGATHGAK